VDATKVFERMPLYGVTDMWVPLTVLNSPHYWSANILPTKRKIGAAPFLLPNTERNHSILRI
jgi:hypothetical protein